MSDLLAKAFKKLSEELPEHEQDAFAQWVLQLIERDDRDWDARFAASADRVEKLAEKALAEYADGRAEILDRAKLPKL